MLHITHWSCFLVVDYLCLGSCKLLGSPSSDCASQVGGPSCLSPSGRTMTLRVYVLIRSWVADFDGWQLSKYARNCPWNVLPATWENMRACCVNCMAASSTRYDTSWTHDCTSLEMHSYVEDSEPVNYWCTNVAFPRIEVCLLGKCLFSRLFILLFYD